jgi:hypothetical protein
MPKTLDAARQEIASLRAAKQTDASPAPAPSVSDVVKTATTAPVASPTSADAKLVAAQAAVDSYSGTDILHIQGNLEVLQSELVYKLGRTPACSPESSAVLRDLHVVGTKLANAIQAARLEGHGRTANYRRAATSK